MWQFTEIYQYGGITVHPGIVLKGDIVETETTVSLRGSDVFKDIPKSILQPYVPTLPATKSRKKAK
jgi:hypothetical protein